MNDNERRSRLQRIAGAARWTGVRLRISEALRWTMAGVPVPLLVAIVSLAWVKVRRLDWAASRPYWITTGISLGLVLLVGVVAMVRKRPRLEGAIALDRYHGLRDRLTNALYFSALSDRTELMDLAIDDGCVHAERLAPGKAAPIRFPPRVPLAALLGAALVLIAMFEVRVYRTVAQAKTIDTVALAADDIDYFREQLKEFEKDKHSAEVQATVDRFNQLVEDIANKRLDRTEAFRRMEALDRELGAGEAADKKALEEGLKRIAEQLRKSDLMREAADAMGNKNLEEAEKKLRELARQMRDKPKSISKAQLERLRNALEEASKQNEERLKEIERLREELQQDMDRLLKKKSERPDGGADEQEERLLRKKQRELERLNRELEQQRSAGRQLSRLDRELAQAAEDLLRDLGTSAQDLEQGAEDLNRMAREQMTDQQKEELRQRIQQLRELLRQQGQGGRPRIVRLRRFSEAARGQRGQRGQGRPGQGGEDGEQGQPQAGQGQRPGRGNGGGEEVWAIGPDGQEMLVIKSAGAGSRSDGAQGGGEQPSGAGDQRGGKEWGTGHDPNLTGEKSNPNMGTQDVTAAGVDTGQGPSRAEVIHGAAERGFVGRSYQRVFTEYSTVAESAIEKEDVPAGYRFYVQRYFQLIRPRE
ncbi:MAG: hypothetical protein MUF54_01415 [Polyangiaceae bacterium]|nr:hypothetical protein [Polyangiaceae bacterium]